MLLKRVGVLSLARVLGLAGLLYGALIGLLYGNTLVLFGLTGMLPHLTAGTLPDSTTMAQSASLVGAFVVGFAVLGAGAGLLHGLVLGPFGNLILRLTGGLALELEDPPGDLPLAPTGPRSRARAR